MVVGDPETATDQPPLHDRLPVCRRCSVTQAADLVCMSQRVAGTETVCAERQGTEVWPATARKAKGAIEALLASTPPIRAGQLRPVLVIGGERLEQHERGVAHMLRRSGARRRCGPDR